MKGGEPVQERFRPLLEIWQRFLLLFAAIFAVYFIATNWQGFESMGQFMWDALQGFPGFVSDSLDYFASVPTEPLLYSVGIGAVFGAVSTALVLIGGRDDLGVILARPGTWLGIGAGAVVGAIGAQIAMYPTQHCTYQSSASGAEFRIGLLVTALGAILLLAPLWAILRSNPLAKREFQAGHFRLGFGLPYFLVLPTLVILVLFIYYPAVQIMLLSLRKKVFPLPQERFSCMQNYVTLAEDTVYRNSFTTTLFIMFFIVLLSLALALGIAVLASQKVKGSSIYRTFLIWPYAISPVVTGVIFLSMFREGGAGLLNWALGNTLGITPGWLTDRDLAPWVIIAASVWNLLGFNILFYIAGLQNVPEELLEAASLDGANRSTRFWRITFPLLSPFTFFLLITNVTYSFYGIYGMVDTLTPQGGPRFGPGGESGATNVLIFKLYNDAFKTGAPAGFGAAQAVVLFLMVAGLTLIQFRLIERRVTYEG